MNDTCCCTKNQALLTTEEAALYLGVPVSYLICARSPKCPGCLVPPPKFVRLRAEKKGAKWVRYPRIELDRWLTSLPLREKTEIAKTDNGINKVLSDVKQKNCVLIMAILKGVDQDKIDSTILKSLAAESAENKQNK
ncbi:MULTISPECIES: helix-turn-helix domain-containing protein [Synergistaceae]|uniref:helix-turn-helix domain-containing protein n=1 Tax=Synergistaceae TaxID=649777 RepID=UPI003AEE3505|nr:helix-turn-helix domain-containing protein [Synergistaceae bacterium DZ-S4]